MRKYIVEYSGHTVVEAENKDAAIDQAMYDGLLDLDFYVYTKYQWQKKNKKEGV